MQLPNLKSGELHFQLLYIEIVAVLPRKGNYQGMTESERFREQYIDDYIWGELYRNFQVELMQ